jgi:glycerophosphoryl diester phosphodiesterase
MVSAALNAGYQVMTYTANDPGVVAELAAWGVDAIITDAVDVIKP